MLIACVPVYVCTCLPSHWDNQLRAIIGWRIDQCANRVCGHFRGREGFEEGEQSVGSLRRGIEPLFVGRWRQNHGHAIVDGSHQFIRFNGDDGCRADGASLRGMPLVPETREGEGLTRLEKDVVRDLGLRPRLGLPLVESVGEDETAFVLERAAEGWFLG